MSAEISTANADSAELAAQLQEDGIAFGINDPTHPVNAGLERDLLRALEDVAAAGGPSRGEVNIVVLEHTPQHVPHLRDLAQDLQLATGADTVLVRTPHNAIGVSETFTRAQVEQGERAMIALPDYAEGVRAFFSAAESFSVPWMGLALGIVVLVAAVTAVTVGVSRAQTRPQ